MSADTGLTAVFSALGDATRIAIVTRLSDGELPLSKLAEPFDMSQTAVSRHVGVLAKAGLVNIEKRGRTRHCSLRAAPMKEASDWLGAYEKFWSGRFDALNAHLEKSKKNRRRRQNRNQL